MMYNFVYSFYDGHYNEFFENLVTLTENFLSTDKFLKLHKEYILKKIRISIYTQYLEAFKTVRINKMASDFSVTPEFMDEQLSELIAKRKIRG